MNGREMQGAIAVLSEARKCGLRIFVEGGRLACQPKPPEEIKAKIREYRESLFELLLSEENPPDGIDHLEGLRKFAPNLWGLVRVGGGQVGLLWGVHARGVVVSVGPKAGLLTLNPKDVALLDRSSGS